jgi:lipopolysaccharide/colanic/teichoic acid biosynthesis glycosyltransferase
MSASKRALDVLGAAAGILLLWPLLLAIAVLVRLEDGGPALFRQERVGRGGRPFRILKFRTMVTDAERRGGQLTVGRDPRVTRIGHHLRRLKLDELPQLFNVLRGEMSLVGPRPEVPRYVALYSVEQRRVLDLRPGITDPASVEFHDESALLDGVADPDRLYVEQIMPRKIQMNLAYAASATALSDLGVVLRTLALPFGRAVGATSAGSVTPSHSQTESRAMTGVAP